jgi:MFS family permease
MVSKFVPPAGPPRVLAFAQLTNSIGDGAYFVCSALYFTRIVGLSPTQVGLGLTLGWAIGSFAGVPLGHLADRRGPKGVAILLAVATGVAVSSFLVVRSFVPFLIAAILYTTCQCGLAAARQALLAGLVDAESRTKIRAYLQATTNAGIAIGAALGGVALQFDTRTAYLAAFALDAASFLASALVLLRVPSVAGSPRVHGEPALAVLRDRPYALISFLNMIMLLYMPMLSLILPLWIVEHTAAPRWMVSTLLVLNTVAVVLFQVRVAKRVTGLGSAARELRYAGVILLVACAVFALSTAGSSAWLAALVLLAGAALQVVGEMMLGSGSWEISFGLAPANKHGQYQGFFGTGVAIARMLGPSLLIALIITWGAPGWFVLGGLFLAAGFAMGPAVAWAARTRSVSLDPPEHQPHAPVTP